MNQKVQKSPGNANLLSQLAVVDADKEAATYAAKRAVEILPVSRDAKDGPGLLTNLAVVYAWSSELDNAFKTINLGIEVAPPARRTAGTRSTM